MLIAIDIGNTNIVVGLYRKATLKDHLRIATRPSMTSDEAGMVLGGWLDRMSLSPEDIDSVILCSVVPPLTTAFETTSRRHLGCLPTVVSHRLKLPITIEIDQPDQVGADRIANAVAGFAKFGGPAIIVDFGTATTFDVIDPGGAYIGGVILPGPETSMTELARKAARLFEVRIEPPDSVVGKSTAGALKSGLFYGTVGQVDYLIDRIIEETGFSGAKVIATGGLAAGIEKYSRHVKLIEPALTLEGLRIISETN
ncbi:MAG: type III pantothenate kinase [Candidatus Zixiibacteriota bacterium]|nr:MAG: type III pantothenate kinase [candidate division Zixibacteria bacterium]